MDSQSYVFGLDFADLELRAICAEMMSPPQSHPSKGNPMTHQFIVNNLSKKLYSVLGNVIDTTLTCPEEQRPKTLYMDLEDTTLCVRSTSELKAFFSPASEESPSAVLERQALNIKYPLLDIILGLVANIDESLVPMVPELCNEYLAYLADDSDHDPDYIASVQNALTTVTGLEKAGLFRSLVVKIQIPLATNAVTPACLVYTEDRSFSHLMTMSPDILALAGEYPKVYAHARLWVNGVFQVVCATEEDLQW